MKVSPVIQKMLFLFSCLSPKGQGALKFKPTLSHSRATSTFITRTVLAGKRKIKKLYTFGNSYVKPHIGLKILP